MKKGKKKRKKEKQNVLRQPGPLALYGGARVDDNGGGEQYTGDKRGQQPYLFLVCTAADFCWPKLRASTQSPA
jgi:hypothetical protein